MDMMKDEIQETGLKAAHVFELSLIRCRTSPHMSTTS